MNNPDNKNICVVTLQSYDKNFIYGKYNNFEQNHPLFFIDEFRKHADVGVFLLVDRAESKLSPGDNNAVKIVDLKKHLEPSGMLNKLNSFFAKFLKINPLVLVDFVYPQKLKFFNRIKEYIDKSELLYISAEPLLLPILYARLKKKKVIYQAYGIYYELIYSTLKDTRSLIGKICWFFFSLFIFCMEKLVYSMCDVILTISKQDKQFLQNKYKISANKVYSYPFVFDTEQFIIYSESDKNAFKRQLGLEGKQIIISYLAFHLNTNQSYSAIQFLKNNLYPFLKDRGISFRFIILGHKTEDKLFDDDNYFCFPGYFHDTKDLSKYMACADICLAPITVRNGVKSKTITYMAYQKATISTPEGTNGLEVVNGKQLLICSLDEFPDKILELISSAQLRKDLGLNARSFVEKEYSYNAVFSHFKEDLNQWSVVGLGLNP